MGEFWKRFGCEIAIRAFRARRELAFFVILSMLNLGFRSLFLLFNLCLPDFRVGLDFHGRKSHPWQNIGYRFEEWVRKDVHEANLRIGELGQVSQFWWPSKERGWYANVFFHFSLSSKLEL